MIVARDNPALQDFPDPGFQEIVIRVVQGIVFAMVGQQSAEIVFLPLADRLVERQRAHGPSSG